MFYLSIIIIFIIGLAIGSFLNCLIWRVHEEKTVMGRSLCPLCGHKLSWRDNIPLLSFILLKGHCRYCKKHINCQYPLVEFFTALFFVLAFVKNFQFPIFNFQLISNIQFPISGLLTSNFLLLTFRDWLFIAVLIFIFVYDLRWYLVSDLVALPAAGILFLLNLGLDYDWKMLLFSGIIGGSFFLIQYLVSRGKWIGGGDIRLGLLLGLALGWPGVLLAIMLAYFIGAIISLSLVAAGQKKMGSEVPLGAFLAPAALFALFYGEAVIGWYFGLIGLY